MFFIVAQPFSYQLALKGIGSLCTLYPHSHCLLAAHTQLGYFLHESLFSGFRWFGQRPIQLPKCGAVVRWGHFFNFFVVWHHILIYLM